MRKITLVLHDADTAAQYALEGLDLSPEEKEDWSSKLHDRVIGDFNTVKIDFYENGRWEIVK
jgi:hypothetical protein